MTKFPIIKEILAWPFFILMQPECNALGGMIPAQPKRNVTDTVCVFSASLASRKGRSEEHFTAFLMLQQPFRALWEQSSSIPGCKTGDSVYRRCAI